MYIYIYIPIAATPYFVDVLLGLKACLDRVSMRSHASGS